MGLCNRLLIKSLHLFTKFTFYLQLQKVIFKMIECIFCKKSINDDFLFCPYCGKKQAQSEKGIKKRGNGQGTVFKNNGKWAVEITQGYSIENGKRKRIYKRKRGFDTKKQALAYIETLRNNKITPKIITLSQLWDMFENDHLPDISKSKRTAYRIAWNKIKSDVAYRSIDSFTVAELQDITDNYGSSYYTCRDIKNLLSHFYKLAIRDDYIDKNKAQYIKLPALHSTERAIFTGEQIQLLWDNSTISICAHMLIMIYTGIRPGELLTITTDNIHLRDHYMTGGIKSEKGKQRKIIINDKILPIIKRCVESSKKGKLAYYPSSDEFYEAWRSERERLGLPEYLTPYCCRHTFITNLTALNVSPAMLQELAGHEDYETTLNYTHLSINDRLQELNRLS